MVEPSDMIIPLLREMRQDIATGFGRVEVRLDKVETRLNEMDGRLDKMDKSLVTFRHALSADSMFSRMATGEFDERLSDVERRLSDLETNK